MKRRCLHAKTTFLFTMAISTMLLFSCSDPASPVLKNNQTDQLHVINKENRKKPASSFNDTIVIRTRSAVFYNPDSIQLVKIKAVNEKMIFESLMHDCYYQMRNARLVIQRDWPGIQIVNVSKTRWLNFIRKDKSKKVIDLDAVNDICGIYLFDPGQNPERIDMMNIDTELGFYFKK